MKPKQARKVLSDATYPLSSQEQKEFAAPTTLQYCKAKAQAKILGISVCQTKECLIREVDRKMFFDSSIEKVPSKDLQKHYETELFLHQRLSAEEGVAPDPVASLPGYEEAKGLSTVLNETWPTGSVKLGCDELYKSLGNFARPNMVFFDHLRNVPVSSSLTPIVYLPYVIATIPHLSEAVVKKFCRYIGLNTQYHIVALYR